MLIGTNTINGLAAAGQLSFSVFMGELISNRMRGPINAFVLSTSVPFAVFGPPITHAFYKHTALQWRWSNNFWCHCKRNRRHTLLYLLPPANLRDASYRRQIRDKVIEVLGLGRNHPTHRRPRRVFDWAELGEISLSLEVRSCPWGTFWRFLRIGHFLRLGRQLWSRISTDSRRGSFAISNMMILPNTLQLVVYYYSMTVVWPTMAGAPYTTDAQEIDWLSLSTFLQFANT